MAGKKKTMGRGLGSLLDRRTTASSATGRRGDRPSANAAGSARQSDISPLESADSSAPSDVVGHDSNNSSNPNNTVNASNPNNLDLAPDSSASQASQNEETAATLSQNAINSEVQKSSGDSNSSESLPESANGDKLRLLGIDQIQRGSYQPRRHFDPELLQELADSLKSEGLIQPILVRPNGTGGYELIAGERRWRAAQLAGLNEIPAIVRTLEDRAVAAVSLIENIQRKDLNPLEEAEALRRLCEEFGLSHQEVADSVGRSRSAVTNLMRLLDLHDEVKTLVDVGDIDMGHARALLGAPFDDQPSLARKIAKQGLTVRAVEQQIKLLRTGKQPRQSNSNVSDPDIDRLAKHLSDKFGASVSIKHKASGAGRLEISYNNMEELDGILNHFK